MQRQHIVLRSSILFVLFALIRSTAVEIFIEDSNGTIVALSSFQNQSYQIPLFQSRQLIIQIDPDLLMEDRQLVGYKFQLQSTDNRVIEVTKKLVPGRKQETEHVLVEDLFICEFKVRLMKLSS